MIIIIATKEEMLTRLPPRQQQRFETPPEDEAELLETETHNISSFQFVAAVEISLFIRSHAGLANSFSMLNHHA